MHFKVDIELTVLIKIFSIKAKRYFDQLQSNAPPKVITSVHRRNKD